MNEVTILVTLASIHFIALMSQALTLRSSYKMQHVTDARPAVHCAWFILRDLVALTAQFDGHQLPRPPATDSICDHAVGRRQLYIVPRFWCIKSHVADHPTS